MTSKIATQRDLLSLTRKLLDSCFSKHKSSSFLLLCGSSKKEAYTLLCQPHRLPRKDEGWRTNECVSNRCWWTQFFASNKSLSLSPFCTGATHIDSQPRVRSVKSDLTHHFRCHVVLSSTQTVRVDHWRKIYVALHLGWNLFSEQKNANETSQRLWVILPSQVKAVYKHEHSNLHIIDTHFHCRTTGTGSLQSLQSWPTCPLSCGILKITSVQRADDEENESSFDVPSTMEHCWWEREEEKVRWIYPGAVNHEV